jgi:hypothetical protein
VKVRESRDNLLAGAIFLAFGGLFAYLASTYEVGTLLAMGPGYFPMVLGLILAALGVVILATGLLTLRREGPVAPSPSPPQGVGVDRVGVDRVGVDRVGVDRVGVDRVGGDRVGADLVGVAGSVDAREAPKRVDAVGTEAEERGSVPWGQAALLLIAILFFGATIDGLGLAPTLFVTVFLAALAGHGTSWVAATAISMGVTSLSFVIFVMVLQLRLPLVGPWLGG